MLKEKKLLERETVLKTFFVVAKEQVMHTNDISRETQINEGTND